MTFRGLIKAVGHNGFAPYCSSAATTTSGVIWGSMYGVVVAVVVAGCYCAASISLVVWKVRKK
jgi:hypothetical protein